MPAPRHKRPHHANTPFRSTPTKFEIQEEIDASIPTYESDQKPWEAARTHLIAATDASDTAERVAIKTARYEALKQTQSDDRQSLADWSAEQAAFIEKEHQRLTKALVGAGEHPDPKYAAQVRRLGGLGHSPDVIALRLGITEGVLMHHYETDLQIGASMMLDPVMANMVRIGASGNDKAAGRTGMEILSRRGGHSWRPPAQKVEISDARKSSKGVIDSSKLSPEDREYLKGIVERQLGLRNNSTMLTGGLAGGHPTVIDVEPDEMIDGDEV